MAENGSTDTQYWRENSERVSKLCAIAARYREVPVPTDAAAELEAARQALAEKGRAMSLKERLDYFEGHLHPGAFRNTAEIVVAASLLLDRTEEIHDLFD